MINPPHPNLLPEPYMAQEKGLSILVFDHFLTFARYLLIFKNINLKLLQNSYISTISTPSIRATVIKSLSPRPETVAIII